jgi:L-threonylcarbamoyladenylate synthase
MAHTDRPALCKTEHLSAIPGTTPEQVRAAIARAAQILQAGGTVAFPTETVYGLAANALSPAAVEGIFTAKSRPHWDPLIVHIASPAMLGQVALVPPELQPRVAALIAAHWPGPLTLLLSRTSAIPDAVTAGRPLVGVRIPAHPLALALIQATGLPLAAPSANRFGHTSPTTAAHVLDDLDGRIDALLDGGPSQVGVESTVLDPAAMLVYRPGAVTLAQLTATTGHPAALYSPTQTTPTHPESLPSPGVGIRHYAPRARLILIESPSPAAAAPNLAAATNQALLTAARTAADQRPNQRPIGIMLPTGWQAPPAAELFPWGDWSDHDQLAQRLFAGLRDLDARNVALILCPVPPGDGIAAALRDRLEKAARPA